MYICLLILSYLTSLYVSPLYNNDIIKVNQILRAERIQKDRLKTLSKSKIEKECEIVTNPK